MRFKRSVVLYKRQGSAHDMPKCVEMLFLQVDNQIVKNGCEIVEHRLCLG